MSKQSYEEVNGIVPSGPPIDGDGLAQQTGSGPPLAAATAATSSGGRRVLGSGSAAMETSAQGFGCMGMTAFYGRPMDDDAAVALLAHAFVAGVTHFDTAEVYTAKADDGVTTLYNECVVGKAIAAIGKRESIQVTLCARPSLPRPILLSCPPVCICFLRGSGNGAA